jgi:PAS domain S-box-containing protein
VSLDVEHPELARLRRRLERERRARREAEQVAERSTRDLYEREQSFRALFAGNPYPMWVYDRETLRILEVNSAAVTTYGYSRDEFLAMSIDEMRPPQEVERLLESLKLGRDVLEQTRPWRHLLKDGRVIDVQIVSHTLRFADRDAAVVLAQDITTQREIEAAKSVFLTAVNHELRTPLTSMLGFLDLLQARHGELTEDMRTECLERVAKNAEKLSGLVNDLLDVDRLGRGILEARRREVDVSQLAQRIVNDMGWNRHIHVVASPLLASVDPAMVERIVENLVGNALTHTPAGTEIWVKVSGDETGLTLTVEDNGPGVPANMRDNVFRPFDHGSGSPGYSPGIGIGLSLVRHFARLHGGDAWVEERDGGGACIQVFLAHPSTE